MPSINGVISNGDTGEVIFTLEGVAASITDGEAVNLAEQIRDSDYAVTRLGSTRTVTLVNVGGLGRNVISL